MRWFPLAALLSLAVGLLVSCNNFSFQHPMGIPTASISVGDRSLTSSETTIGDEVHILWTLAFTIEARTLPGSGGGVIHSYSLEGGGSLSAGTRVEACPSDSEEPCGPFVTSYSFEYLDSPPAEGSYVITGYDVVSDNGAVLHITLPAKLQIR